MPWREKLLELSPDALILVVVIAFISIVFLKAYAIGIVWRCYKYLTMRQHNLRTLLPCVLPELAANMTAGERAYSTLLPNYDEAIAQYLKQSPPPSYQVAMSNIPDPVDVVAPNDNNNETPNNNNTVHVNANAMIQNANNNNDTVIEPPPYNPNMEITVNLNQDVANNSTPSALSPTVSSVSPNTNVPAMQHNNESNA